MDMGVVVGIGEHMHWLEVNEVDEEKADETIVMLMAEQDSSWSFDDDDEVAGVFSSIRSDLEMEKAKSSLTSFM